MAKYYIEEDVQNVHGNKTIRRGEPTEWFYHRFTVYTEDIDNALSKFIDKPIEYPIAHLIESLLQDQVACGESFDKNKQIIEEHIIVSVLNKIEV